MKEVGAEDISARTHCQQYGWNLPSCNDSTSAQEDSGESETEKSRGDAGKEGDTSCSMSDLAPPSDRLITCAAVLLLVFCLRRLLLAVMAHCTSRQPPPSLGFPAWEGPVALVQYLSVCESTAAAASLSCPAGIGLGVTVLLAGPVTLFLVSVYYIRRHLQDGEMLFEYNAMPSYDDFRRRVCSGHSISAKLFLAYSYSKSVMERGAWKDTSLTVFWSFIVGDVCGPTWNYPLWLLIKRMWMALVLNFFDGPVSAALSFSVQVVDTALLLYLRPFILRKTDLTETVGAVFNLLSFFAISLPVMAGPDFLEPPFLGDLTKIYLASVATVVSAVVALLSPITFLVSLLYSHLTAAGK
jgi:hypothetical protein